MLPPFRFAPLLKVRAWGGSRLGAADGASPGSGPIGESWELADLPESIEHGQSRVAGGPFDGAMLRDLRSSRRADLLGIAEPGPSGAFPLLVKYLDARENLSLQVHPDAAYVARHPDAHLKTEAWFIVDCRPGARVYRGIRRATTRAEFIDAVASGRALDHVESLEVSPGDCVFLPSGICHALGAGILAAEVQTPSDTTFRVWDWDRNDPSRPLHLEQALECMRFGSAQDDPTPARIRTTDAPTLVGAGVVTRRMCRSGFFTIELLDAVADTEIPVDETGLPEVWMTIDGLAAWRTASGAIDAGRGVTVLRPARVETGIVRLDRGTRVLRTFCGSALDRALSSD